MHTAFPTSTWLEIALTPLGAIATLPLLFTLHDLFSTIQQGCEALTRTGV
jgi:hypothetical protein